MNIPLGFEEENDMLNYGLLLLSPSSHILSYFFSHDLIQVIATYCEPHFSPAEIWVYTNERKYVSKDLLPVIQKWEVNAHHRLWQRIHQMILQSEFNIPIEKKDLDDVECIHTSLLDQWRAIDLNEVSKIYNLSLSELSYAHLLFISLLPCPSYPFQDIFQQMYSVFFFHFWKTSEETWKSNKTWIEEILSFFVRFIRQVWMIKNPRINIAWISLLCLALFQSIKKVEEYTSELAQRNSIHHDDNKELSIMHIHCMITNGFRGKIFDRMLPLLISQEVHNWKRIIVMLIRKSYRLQSLGRQSEKFGITNISYQSENFVVIFGKMFTFERLTEASQLLTKAWK